MVASSSGLTVDRSSHITGTLTQLQGNIVVPSTLSYKERTELRRKDTYEYGRIYNTPNEQGMSVFDRLTADASVRQTMKGIAASGLPPSNNDSFASMDRTAALTAAAAAVAGMEKPYQPTSCETRKAHTHSGWVDNNNINLLCKQQQADTSCTTQAPLSALHPHPLRSFYKKCPLDFLAAARPQARTTTETLRMMGAYSSDKLVAEQLGVHVPNACSSAKLTLQ